MSSLGKREGPDLVRLLEEILPQVAKPGRYTGGEWNAAVKDWDGVEVRFLLAYPDVYEVGMSNLGLSIIYQVLNSQDWALAERAFAPWMDMEEALRGARLPLYSLETKHALSEFDVLGFSLGYELAYSNVLNMLDLAGIPLLAEERDGSHPMVIAGGSAAANPEPLADFFDLLVIGDGEEVVLELAELTRRWKGEGEGDRRALLRAAADIEGVYVPGLYEVAYNSKGEVAEIMPKGAALPFPIRRRIVHPLPPPPTKPIVPYLSIVHDRATIEIQRGCTRGCRFCQAGVLYRPVRERPVEEVVQGVEALLRSTGYDEVGLVSLSSSDYSRIEELVGMLLSRFGREWVSFSLPSLRADSFSVGLAELIQAQRKIGLTFAPEAGSQRLRDCINKRVTQEEILATAERAYEAGWQRIKLYFMLGLPTETREDIEELAELVHRIRALGWRRHRRKAGVNLSLSAFIPKPHTPFQWEPMEGRESLQEKLRFLRQRLRGGGVSLRWPNLEAVFLEAVLSRGDRRLGRVIRRAWEAGARFDSWDECFNYGVWEHSFAAEGLDPHFYAGRPRAPSEVLPWSHIHSGVSAPFLWAERERALRGEVSPDCRQGPCLGCGIRAFYGLAEEEEPLLAGRWKDITSPEG